MKKWFLLIMSMSLLSAGCGQRGALYLPPPPPPKPEQASTYLPQRFPAGAAKITSASWVKSWLVDIV